MRSPLNGRARTRIMRNNAGLEMEAEQKPSIFINDPEAQCRATLLGLGVGLVAVSYAAPHLANGALVRLLPDWHVDLGSISLYFASQKLLPAKTRAFIDFAVQAFAEQKLTYVLSAKSLAKSKAA